MRTITREQFFAEWREECRLFLRRRCARFGSQLLDAIKKGTLVVKSEARELKALAESLLEQPDLDFDQAPDEWRET